MVLQQIWKPLTVLQASGAQQLMPGPHAVPNGEQQVPLVHGPCATQPLPQAPQLAESVCRLTHLLLQSVSPAGQDQ